MPACRASLVAFSAARSLRSRGRGCPNGVAQTVPVSSALPTVSRCLCCSCLSNVCRSPPPRSRLPVRVACLRPRRVKAVQEERSRCGGTLVLALTGVVDLCNPTGGTFTHHHLSSFFLRF